MSILDEILATGTPVVPPSGEQPPTPPAKTEEGQQTIPPTPQSGEPSVPPATTEAVDLVVFGDEYKGKTIVDVANEFKAVKQKSSQVETELNEYKSKKLDYASPAVAEYDSWVRNGGTEDYRVFSLVKNFNPETQDKVDILVAKKVLENPAFIGHEKVIKDEILKAYALEADAELGITQEQVEFNKTRLSQDALLAQAFIKEQQGKLQVPQSVQPVNNEALLQERKTNWSKAADQMMSSLKSLPIPGAVKNGDKWENPEIASFAIPENILSTYREQLVEAFSKMADPTPENQNIFKAQLYQKVVVENLPFIVQAAVDTARTKLEEEYDKKYAGGVVRTPSAAPLGGEGLSGDAHLRSLLGG